jgi:hypothetical protein
LGAIEVSIISIILCSIILDIPAIITMEIGISDTDLILALTVSCVFIVPVERNADKYIITPIRNGPNQLIVDPRPLKLAVNGLMKKLLMLDINTYLL